MLFVLILSLLLYLFPISESVIKPVVQVVKILSLAVGNLVFLKGERGLLRGLICGFLASLLCLLLFGLIGGDLRLSALTVLELFLGMIAGGISGILAVNLKKSG